MSLPVIAAAFAGPERAWALARVAGADVDSAIAILSHAQRATCTDDGPAYGILWRAECHLRARDPRLAYLSGRPPVSPRPTVARCVRHGIVSPAHTPAPTCPVCGGLTHDVRD